MRSALNKLPLHALIGPDTVLVAAGQRLARHLVQRYTSEARACGRLVWETPQILTYGAWLARFWHDAMDGSADRRLLLSVAQEAVLWERVILDSARGAPLLSAAATAGLAREAWTLMHAWELPRSELKSAAHEDVQTFRAWAETFEQVCREYDWLDNARLPDAVIELIAQKRLRGVARVVLSGFDEFTPQQQRLVDTLRRSGCEIVVYDQAQVTDARTGKIALPSAGEEILAAARWTRAQLQARPEARIGIVAPDLSTHHRAIRRVFDDVLLPESVLPGNAEMARPYNVSLGERLAAQPLIESAFAVLELAQGELPLAQLSALLCSPYLAGAQPESTRRALLDRRLRAAGDVRVDIATLARALGHAREGLDACPIFAERLVRFRSVCTGVAATPPPSRWLAIMAQLLASLGWPGDRSRTSVEHQTIEAWRELLGEFGALDPVLPSLRYADALSRLRRMTQEKLFQRETPETPAQILGVLEASGLGFDALWVMGLHDEVWPSPPRPNPFLPIGLQRARGLPHASAERELEFCARLTQRLLKSAPDVVCSHPRRDEDRDLRPSPLIRALPELNQDVTAMPAPLYRDVVHRQSRRESMIDEVAPPLAAGVEARGGTALFRSQSACPFRGYAEFRLGAHELPEPEPGLSAADRGTLVHDLLARLWQELGSHAQLVAWPADRLSTRVTQLVGEEIEKLKYRRPATMTDRTAALEAERLAALAFEWLALEKTRTPFHVRREEAGTYLVVGGMRTKARMDRIDELSDGGLVVIDYKTGDASIKDWFGERPAQPQLPLYALYGVPRERVAALFYGRIRRGESAFLGLAREGGVAPGIEAYNETKDAVKSGSWDALLKTWDDALIALADEHGRGHARVSPRDRGACEHCHLHPFCRVHERRARLMDTTTDEEGGHD